MADKDVSRRKGLMLQAVNPADGKTCEVQVSFDRMHMTVTSNEEFAKRMLLLARPAEQFEPTATYDPDGDCIEFLAKAEPFYGERVDDLLTVYYSQETDEVIGSLLKGVSRFCKQMLEKMPGFKIEVHDGRFKLVHIFRARLWSSQFNPQDMPALVYRKLIEVADDAEVDAELCLTR